MATILYRNLLYLGMAIIACLLLLVCVYNKGYSAAENRCQKEKLELIIQKEVEKEAIVAEIRKKSPVERRKALKRYVIKEN